MFPLKTIEAHFWRENLEGFFFFDGTRYLNANNSFWHFTAFYVSLTNECTSLGRSHHGDEEGGGGLMTCLRSCQIKDGFSSTVAQTAAVTDLDFIIYISLHIKCKENFKSNQKCQASSCSSSGSVSICRIWGGVFPDVGSDKTRYLEASHRVGF